MAEVYLALYKGKADGIRARFEDWLIRTITRSQYSHCEIAVRLPTYCVSSYACYGSSWDGIPSDSEQKPLVL